MKRRANNEGTICKRTRTVNGKTYTYWEAKVTVGYDPITGKAIRKSFSADTQKEVKEKMQDVSVQVSKKEYFDPSKMTVSEWADLWIEKYCGDIKYRTKKTYRAQLNTHIKPALGEVRLSDLTTEKIQLFYNQLEENGKTVRRRDKEKNETVVTQEPLSPKSIKNVHCVLSKCLNDAIRLNYLKYNPSSRTTKPRVNRYEFIPLADDQVKAFLEALDKEKYRSLYLVYLFTGMRESEAIGLTWDCINYKTKIIKLYQQLQKRPVADGGYTFAPLKNDEIRYLSMPDFLVDVFTDRYDEQDRQKEEAGELWQGYQNDKERKTALIFTTELGTPINPKVVYKHYKRMAADFDMSESRVHDLRHTFATISLQNGDDYKTLQSNLGHASAAFTLDIYGHTTDRMKSESASRMQSYINSTIQKPQSDEDEKTPSE